MNSLEQELDYPFGDALPALGATLEVAPGLRWLRMRLPFALDHINLWLIRDEIQGPEKGTPCQGWTIVDCGIDNPPTRLAWEHVFDTELGGLPVLRLIVTHMHPDHMGLAHWLTERWSTAQHECRLWMSATDYRSARLATSASTDVGGAGMANFMAAHGLADDESLRAILNRTDYYAQMVPRVPAQYRRMRDGDVLRIGGREWECRAGYGHAPEHIALYCAELGVLISGDMLLPRISTNVSVDDSEPEGNPLALFLESLEQMRPLPDATLVLPSHGRPFRGVHTRIDQLVAHHAAHLADVLAACAQAPQSAHDLLDVLFKRKLDLHQTTFAMGEAVAHLNALWLRGELRRATDAHGVFRFLTA